MRLLDTSAMISVLRGDEEVKSIVENTTEELCTTTITRFELFSRIYHRGLVKEEKVLRRLIKGLALLTFDEESSDKAAEIMGFLLRVGKPVNVIDVLIAGIAVANGVEEIVTRDRDFKTIEDVYGHLKVVLLTGT
ncbi:MAG: type II toxin-antitoxin system VapC family toxin [Thermoproteota archaeon]|nr:type II toxin-antitoxin system VapC family toxin [Candidatus Brockarchaeota archaeon]